MANPEQALQTQLANIQTRTGKSLDQLAALVKASGLTKHGELREMLKRDLDLGYGDANTLVHHLLKSDGASTSTELAPDEILDGIYKGPKAALRPIHDAIMARIHAFGAFEVAPKKDYVSLRRKKQFAMIGPPANARIEVGLNLKGVEGNERLLALPAGGMCPFKVKITSLEEVDDQLLGWIQQAYNQAG